MFCNCLFRLGRSRCCFSHFLAVFECLAGLFQVSDGSHTSYDAADDVAGGSEDCVFRSLRGDVRNIVQLLIGRFVCPVRYGFRQSSGFLFGRVERFAGLSSSVRDFARCCGSLLRSASRAPIGLIIKVESGTESRTNKPHVESGIRDALCLSM